MEVSIIAILLLIFIIVIQGLFIEKYKKLIKYYDKEISKLHTVIDNKISLLNEHKHEITKYEYFKTSLKVFCFDKAIDFFKNKFNDHYIVMERISDKDIDYLFSGTAHKGLINCPRILATIVDDVYIWIDDIFAIDEDRGNGSMLLLYLINKAKEMKNIRFIKGELSPSDIERFDKLEYFYKKNGFEVKFNNDRTHGLIKMVL